MGPIRRASPCLHIVLGGTPFEGVWCRHRRQSQFPPRFSRHSCLFVAVSGGSAAMSAGDDNRFRPRPGRIRADTPKVGRVRSFLTRVRTVTRQQQAATGASGRPRGGGPSHAPRGQGSIASGRGVRRGRGVTFVRARNLSNGWSYRRPGSRRVIVKSRSVRGAGRNGKAAAHLRYLSLIHI